MRREETRYKGVWSAGYRAAMEDVTSALVRLLQAGGEVRAREKGTLQPRVMAFLGDEVVTGDDLSAVVRRLQGAA